MSRNKYVKVYLTAAVPYDLSGCTVVGHVKNGDSPSLLLERPEGKPRAKAAARKPRTRAGQPATVVAPLAEAPRG